MKRILVIGNSGSGKSTMAMELGRLLDLPVIHLDRVFWKPGWVESSKEEFDASVRALAKRPRWVMDGNYTRTLPLRLKRADTVIFFDLGRWTCLFRIYKRVIGDYGKVRQDMAPGCPEKLPDWEFLKFIWTFPSVIRPCLTQAISSMSKSQRLIHLRSTAHVSAFLEELNLTLKT